MSCHLCGSKQVHINSDDCIQHLQARIRNLEDLAYGRNIKETEI